MGVAGLDGEFNFSTAGIVAGLVFGVFGMYLLKLGRKEGNIPHLMIGLALLVYPFYFQNNYALWGIGIGLLFMAYRFR